MKIHIDRDRCKGHGVCESLAPTVFEIRDDGRAYLLTEHVTADLRESIQGACDQCPAEAPWLED